jgi:hypothetical protein
MASDTTNKEDYSWFVEFKNGRPFLVTGDIDYIATKYPFAKYRPATKEDVERLERKAAENKRLDEKLKKARR